MGGGQDKLAWTAYPHPCNYVYRKIRQRKQLNFIWIMFKIDTSLQSDRLKEVELAQWLYFETQVGGGQNKLAWTAYP